MSIRALRTRLRKLSGDRVDAEHCPGGVTCVLGHAAGEPQPELPPDAYRCERCDQPHVLLLEEVVVEAPAGAEALPAGAGIPQQ